jgi:hypothetical protein
MAQVPYKNLVAEIAPLVKGCPTPTITARVARVAREFYERSLAYTYPIAPVDVDELATSIELELPDDTELYAPGDLTFDGLDLIPITVEQANGMYGRWDDPAAAVINPRRCFVAGETALSLVPLPLRPITEALRGRVRLIPTLSATGLESSLYNKHSGYILYGTVAYLVGMPDTDWFKPSLVGYYTQLYQDGIESAARQADGNHVPTGGGTTGYGGI